MDDLRHALRSLRREPGFAAVAVITLAFGIGVNVSLFGLLSAFFLRPLGVEDADRLVFVLQRSEAIAVPYGHSYPDYREYRARLHEHPHLLSRPLRRIKSQCTLFELQDSGSVQS